MIDTIKIYTEINEETYNYIKNKSIIKSSVNNNTNELLYEITNDSLEGSYSSKLSIRVGSGIKYQFTDLLYYIEIEGSYHKIVRGYNSHNGYKDLHFICNSLINIVTLTYNIDLPSIEKWNLQRCDIAICYDLTTQENIKSYINSLSRCNYPRRNMKFYHDESIYLSGTTTTLKIYNKYIEFKKHDMKKFYNTQFNLSDYIRKIKGYIRFECEIKKKKLISIYNEKHIKVLNVKYEDLKKVWSEEFMKLLKYIENDLNIVRNREDVYRRLSDYYNHSKTNLLYNFYSSIQLNGLADVKKITPKSTYYRNIKSLKDIGIDFSQSYKIEEISIYYFNPFTNKEIA